MSQLSTFYRGTTALVLVAVFVAACSKEREPTPGGGADTTGTGPHTSRSITYTPMPSSFQFLPDSVIDGWVNSNPPNTADISAHCWNIWRGMTTPSGQTLNGTNLPVWDTWYSGTEVYLDNPDTSSTGMFRHHPFETPKQIGHVQRRLGDRFVPNANVLSFNRFTKEIRDHVDGNRYYNADSLTAINAAFPANTPLAGRTVKNFPNTSIMLKPVFWIVSGTRPTVVPYWNGTTTAATTDPLNPTPETWKQGVLVDPTGTAKNDHDITVNPVPKNPVKGIKYANTVMKAGTYKVVPVSTDWDKSWFYALKLTEADIKAFKDFNMFPQSLDGDSAVAGDYALFVASHVSSREITNWTWQTFWWLPDVNASFNSPPNKLAPPSDIPSPWNHYAAVTAYYMTPQNKPGGTPLVAYNPYLETNLSGLLSADQKDTTTGVLSNCMSCHRAAAWPGTDQPYATATLLLPDNPLWFTGNMKTDFLWSIPVRAHTSPFKP